MVSKISMYLVVRPIYIGLCRDWYTDHSGVEWKNKKKEEEDVEAVAACCKLRRRDESCGRIAGAAEVDERWVTSGEGEDKHQVPSSSATLGFVWYGPVFEILGKFT